MPKILLFILLLISVSGFCQEKLVFENLGESINSRYDEVNPLISPDGKTIYFIRNDHPENSLGPIVTQDIWSSEFNTKDSTWSKAKHLDFPFNQQRFNAVCGISPNGNILIIKGAYKKGKYKGRGLSVVRKKRNRWSLPEKLDIEDFDKMSKGKYNGAFVSSNGEVLLMYLSEKKDDPTCDLYVSFPAGNDKWTKPLNLGPIINTPHLEASPFLASDGVTLYFSSTRPGGHGEADVYVTKRLDDSWTKWTKPRNLGPSVNSEGRETYYTLSASGDYGYMVRDPGKFGKSDIIKIKTEASQKPDPVVLVFGKVLNAITKEPLEADISYEILSSGKSAGAASSNPETGEYKIILPKGQNYGFSAMIDGYIPVSENLNLKNLQSYEEVNKDLLLVPVQKGQAVRLNNIFFESGSAKLKAESFPELNRLVSVFDSHKKLKVEIAGHTDNTGNNEMNQKLSEERASAVREYLLSKGINSKSIIAKGYGETVPVAENDTPEGKAMNRRVEFLILDN